MPDVDVNTRAYLYPRADNLSMLKLEMTRVAHRHVLPAN